ncbi:hypothetical protein N5918_01010 [Glaesserella parasuis]|uniref:DUF7424 family protein n=1 Tax=Glaesserella parasuis TaxID=738 RepID=UPI00040CAE72|nr:hypothetical protein [Glaesserella parasuis]MCT8760705.1 hypothetical protein [Glaesserella parasuis]MCT8766823.1 hypothetical protein [Glaesserella parasuis]MDD2170685.1 hypothetical protein [Glaesserella parasuis]MDD2171703.1 hypothetical protein [Glaesserella parasuis]MDO9830566.1 hypothetical protein [Glaesserella parasuis]
MKKLLTLSLFALALSACKTEIEKDISLNKLLTQPLQAETALLNVELLSCNNLEDSRIPSDSLVKIKQKIPTLFNGAVFKECYSKRAQSMAVFEIPVGVGIIKDGMDVPFDIAIYSYDNRPLNIRTKKELSKKIIDFVNTEYLPNFEFSVLLNVKNDTAEDKQYTMYSVYIDDYPLSVGKFKFEKNETLKIKLSNVSADMLWKYGDDRRVTVFEIPKAE